MKLFSLAALPLAAGLLVPKWPATYDMQASTIVMPCNNSGFFDPVFLAQFGVVDFDWSNAKQLWANAHPMNCEELLVQQARMVKAVNPNTRVFVYRNLVKALPWFTGVRQPLTNATLAPAWFLPFKPGGSRPDGSYYVPACDNNYNPPLCSPYYHDQEQTPQHPHGDGSCVEPCDCGGVPCGEYLWAHDSGGQALRDYLINQHVLGPTGLSDPAVDGFYFDDGWVNTSATVLPWEPQPNGFCDHSSIGGPTEVEYHCEEDMGLTQDETTAITTAHYDLMQSVYSAVVDNGGFQWQSFAATDAPPTNASACASWFRSACKPTADTFVGALQFVATRNHSTGALSQLEEDLASFLLIRGPYAWIGYGWEGCTSTSVPGSGGSSAYPFPVEWTRDYGQPADTTTACSETAPGVSGVFTRQWSKASASFDCGSYTGTVTMTA